MVSGARRSVKDFPEDSIRGISLRKGFQPTESLVACRTV
jgi:hypothetical protein